MVLMSPELAGAGDIEVTRARIEIVSWVCARSQRDGCFLTRLSRELIPQNGISKAKGRAVDSYL